MYSGLTYLRRADPIFSSYRTLETSANADGSATTHAIVRCTLADIAQATGLRVEDAAFALNECGLLVRRKRIDAEVKDKDADAEREGGKDAEPDSTEDGTEDCIVISREMVEAVAHERRVKRMCMDLAHVLL